MTTIQKDTTISLGLANTQGKLVTLRAKADDGLRLTTLCPDCTDQAVIGAKVLTALLGYGVAPLVPLEAKIEQWNKGACTHPHYKTGQCRKGVEAKGRGYVPINGDEVKAAKTSDLQDGRIELSVHRAADVESNTWPSGTFYWFEPDKSDDFFNVLAGWLNDPSADDYAFVSLAVIKGSERLVRLRGHRGGIVVQELARPQELNDLSASPRTVSERVVDMATQLVEAVCDDFDPATYSRTQAARLRELIDAKLGGDLGPAVSVAQDDAPVVDDDAALIAQFEAAIAAAKARKAA